MWTDLKSNKEYTAQITPYHGKVNAEILSKNKAFFDPKMNIYLTVLDKSFGSFWRETPTEKNWKDANKWVEEQLKLISEYGTVIVSKPNHLRNP